MQRTFALASLLCTTLLAGATVTGQDADDVRGVYAGITICADCPGIATRIELGSGKTFHMSETFIDRPGPTRISNGMWTFVPSAANSQTGTLRLNAKGRARSWEYRVTDAQELRALDADGHELPSTMPHTLLRMEMHQGHEFPLVPLQP